MQLSEKQFVELVNTHQGIIHKVCGMYCNDKDDKKDLFQEIVLQLWRSVPSFRAEAKISTFIYRVALNVALSGIRKSYRQPVQESISENVLAFPNDNSYEEKSEQLQMLNNAIAQLSEIEKAITLMYLDDHSYEEIAETMGITQNNLRVRMNRIREKLKTIVRSNM